MSTTRISSRSVDQADESRGPGIKIYLAFIPWAMFSLIARHSTPKAAAVAALIGSIAIAAASLYARRPKLLEIGAIVAFAAFAMVAFAVDPSTGHW
ncbi:MAG: hypothetical protein JO039_10950, partial [Solirubrobacterales bacterium]|nr:hypothetical protein [Solirubrobacterales bacterium]